MSNVAISNQISPFDGFFRLIVSVLVAVAVTFSLLWAMQFLISTANRDLDKSKRGQMVDFVRVKKQEIVEKKKVKPKKPPPPKMAPEPPKPQLDDVKPEAEKIALNPVDVSAEIDVSADGFSSGFSDGDMLPIVKVQPQYPRRALSRGIEGYVIVEFTVTKRGGVKNARVIDSVPKTDVFHKSAINAALKFKYKPRVVDGNPVEVAGIRNKITFQIER